jgi:hypothetical protein
LSPVAPVANAVAGFSARSPGDGSLIKKEQVRMSKMSEFSETTGPRLPYFKHYKGEDMLETSLLSIEAVGVYHLLQVQYFYRGGLPNDEKKIRMISKMERDRRWPAIRTELLGPVFKPGWVKPEWDALVRETNVKSAQAKAAVRARYQPDPAPEPDYDSSIPF